MEGVPAHAGRAGCGAARLQLGVQLGGAPQHAGQRLQRGGDVCQEWRLLELPVLHQRTQARDLRSEWQRNPHVTHARSRMRIGQVQP